jgi:hypothetical protein
VVEILSENLKKESGRDLRGSGFLGNGFYMTPNARLAFLYGVRINTPRVFRDQWVFAVMKCVISRQSAKRLRYGTDFYFHDRPTMESIGRPLNGNDLMCREIVLRSANALNSLSLRQVMIVAGRPYGDGVRDNVFTPFEHILRNHPTPPPLSEDLKGYRLYNDFLRDIPMDYIPGFGTVYRIHRYARFIIFDGTAANFLRSLQNSPEYTAIFQKLICDFGTTARIHFSRFSAGGLHVSSVGCFIIEGHVVKYDPLKFFDSIERRERETPMTIMSTSKGMYRPLLIIPPFCLDEKYHNIFNFACRVDPVEFHAFFAYAANIINCILSSADPDDPYDAKAIALFRSINYEEDKGIFLNFHGGSVGWLHLRLDVYPAYYALDEYVILEHATLPPHDMLTRYSDMAKEKEIRQRQERQSRKRRLFPQN